MEEQHLRLPFHEPFAPQLAYAVLRLEPLIEELPLDESSIHLEAALGVMRRTVEANEPHATELLVEPWPWEGVHDMITAVQTASDTITDPKLGSALSIALRFLVNFLAEQQEQQTGERHLLCI